ncbi:hypothetical protein ACEWY4_007787 [Coilia grayii]|uniref:Transposase n=1 Tax=Coilia grayii TaxID=363190 RepID=A0ABD1K925_9TELE
MDAGKGRGRRGKGRGTEESAVVLPHPSEAETSKKQQVAVSPGVEKVALLQENVKMLQKDKEFLQQQMARMTSGSRQCPWKVKTADLQVSTDDGMTLDTSSVETDISSHSETPKKEWGRIRTKSVRGVRQRYKQALHQFNKGGSMKKAFQKVGVDRNTISRTAPIAELAIAAPEAFRTLAPWDAKREKLSCFTERCKAAISVEIKEKIGLMKSTGELLPISY